LGGANSYSGGTVLSNGVLRIAHGSALGTGALSASSGATLELTNGITVANNMSVYTVRFLDGGNTLSGTITNNNSLYSVPAGTTNTVSGFITGTGGLELDGGGVLDVTGTTNNYTGDTVITNGTLRITALANSNTASSVGSGSSITLAGTNGAASAVLDYTGGNVSTDRILVLTNGGGTITMASSATEMTLTGSASGSGQLIVGEGTLILNGATNAFAPGSIQVDSGATLQLGANNQIGDSTGLILNGGTFVVGTASTGFSDTLGTLTLSASSTIDLGAWTTGVRQLTFANSSAITWTGTLTITNWQGVANTSSDVAEILFGTGGLTSVQLSQVYWANQNINGGTLIGGNGELAPIPEARVVWGAAALTAFVLWRERRHFPKLARGLWRRRL
jgi:autotransporter-associated beta strand protein